MDAISLLKEDHTRVRRMLEALDDVPSAEPETRSRSLMDLKQRLMVHEEMEERIFYPALKERSETRGMVLEALEEHDVVDTILMEIEATPPQDETWTAKFAVMKENIGHHIDEEETEMFLRASEVMRTDELERLGERMLEIKEGRA
jgi:hemerythrin-like domain-containing protein